MKDIYDIPREVKTKDKALWFLSTRDLLISVLGLMFTFIFYNILPSKLKFICFIIVIILIMVVIPSPFNTRHKLGYTIAKIIFMDRHKYN